MKGEGEGQYSPTSSEVVQIIKYNDNGRDGVKIVGIHSKNEEDGGCNLLRSWTLGLLWEEYWIEVSHEHDEHWLICSYCNFRLSSWYILLNGVWSPRRQRSIKAWRRDLASTLCRSGSWLWACVWRKLLPFADTDARPWHFSRKYITHLMLNRPPAIVRFRW